jgi:hypothetical protein
LGHEQLLKKQKHPAKGIVSQDCQRTGMEVGWISFIQKNFLEGCVANKNLLNQTKYQQWSDIIDNKSKP